MKRDLKGGSSPELDALLAQAGELKAKYEALVQQQADAEAEADGIMLQLPAIPDPAWPVGKDARRTSSSARGPTRSTRRCRWRTAARTTSRSAQRSASSTSTAA